MPTRRKIPWRGECRNARNPIRTKRSGEQRHDAAHTIPNERNLARARDLQRRVYRRKEPVCDVISDPKLPLILPRLSPIDHESPIARCCRLAHAGFLRQKVENDRRIHQRGNKDQRWSGSAKIQQAAGSASPDHGGAQHSATIGGLAILCESAKRRPRAFEHIVDMFFSRAVLLTQRTRHIRLQLGKQRRRRMPSIRRADLVFVVQYARHATGLVSH